jgi:hypothetical protein
MTSRQRIIETINHRQPDPDLLARMGVDVIPLWNRGRGKYK